ncbi:MAG: hypothetical protein HY335_09855, partial [Deinococcus sp.]|nr:hypothetical protein [Deinococcus sp.]
ALVSPDLLKRLDKLGQKSLSPRSGAFLVGAHYHGKINGHVADFQADFELYSFSEQASLVVPLGGVDLQEGAKLGETPVYPVPLANPQTGYSLVVPGKGLQRLSLSFRVRLSSDQPELRFSIPRLAKSLLDLDLPSAYQVPKVVQALGPQKLTLAQPGQQAHLQAHLGRENTIHVRWHTEQPESASVNPLVREAYFWDLRPPVVGLSAFYQYTVTRGSQGPVAIALPEALEVRSVEVVRLDESTPPRLRQWRVVGKGLARQLKIDFEDSGPGRFQINLFLVPRLFLGADNWHLPLPMPVKAKVSEGFLAYRLEGMEALDKWQNAAISNLAPDDFVRIWRMAGMRDTGALSAAYLFRRTASRSGLVLAITVPKPLLRQELTWTVGPEGADCRAMWQLSAAQEQLLLLEADVPKGITLATVKGPDVLRWTRSGSQLQIWLKQPCKETVVEWTGWLPHAQKTGPGKEGLFALPHPRMPAAKVGPVRLQVVAAPGWEIMAERLQNLQEDLTAPTPGGGMALLAAEGVYGGSFRIRGQTSTPEIHQLTCLERQQGQLVLSAFLDLRLFQGKPQALTVQLRHWPGKEAKLEGPTGVQISHLGQQRGQHLWVVKLPASLPRHGSLQLTARTGWPDTTGRPVPTVTVQGATLKENWFAFLGPQLQLKESARTRPTPVPVKELARWSRQAQRIAEGGTLWRFSPDQDDWHFVANPSSPGAAPVDILLAQQQASVGHQQHWLHQGTYLLWARAATDVRVVLPAGAHLVSASLDDQPLVARQSQPGHIMLPLNEVGRVSRLRLSWAFPKTKETVENPILSSPSFEGLTPRPVVGTLWLPPGYEAAGSLLPPLGLAHLYLQRAWAQVKLTDLLLAN